MFIYFILTIVVHRRDKNVGNGEINDSLTAMVKTQAAAVLFYLSLFVSLQAVQSLLIKNTYFILNQRNYSIF